MNNTEFDQLVREMRHTQKMYFRTREPVTLHYSKQLEIRVDRELELRREAAHGQGTLFDEVVIASVAPHCGVEVVNAPGADDGTND